MTTHTKPDRVTDYLEQLRPYLADLDGAERAEILDELAANLAEVAAETDDPLERVVGPPSDYVAAFRDSAGLTGHGSPPTRGHAVADAARAAAGHLRGSAWWSRATQLGTLLHPAWWTARGAVIAVLVASQLTGRSLAQQLPIPFGANPFGVAWLVACIAASVWIGQQTVAATQPLERRRRAPLFVLNVVAAVGLLMVFSAADSYRSQAYWEAYDAAARDLPDQGAVVADGFPFLSLPYGEPVTNIYPYDLEGRALDDVLLYDGAGNPIELFPPGEQPFPDIETDFQRGPDGTPMTNLYPLDQYIVDDGVNGAVRRPRPTPEPALPGPSSQRAGDPAPEAEDIPDVVGLTRDDATAQLEAAGLAVEVREVDAEPEEVGVVVAQHPPSGDADDSGSVSETGDGRSLVTIDVGRLTRESASPPTTPPPSGEATTAHPTDS